MSDKSNNNIHAGGDEKPPALPPVFQIATQDKKRSFWSSCLNSCMVISFVSMLLIILILIITFGGCFAYFKSFQKVEADTATLAQLGKAATSGNVKKVVHININGIIDDTENSSSWFIDENSSQAALNKIRVATADSSIKGMLLCINSGGGGITASDILWNSLKEFKKKDPKRKIVVMMGSTAASGAYYIAVAGDYIIANPTTITGSMGVILSGYIIKELAQKVGLKNITITSGENKAMFSPFEDMTPEQEEILRQLVDSMYFRFVEIVAEGRGLEIPKVQEYADGRVFLAPEAMEHGLIDEIGYIEDAKEKIREYLGSEVIFIKDVQVPPFMKLIRSPSFWGACIVEAAEIAGLNVSENAGLDLK